MVLMTYIVQLGDKYLCFEDASAIGCIMYNHKIVKNLYFKESFQTWCHRSPVDAPSSVCSTAISTEYKFDNIGSGCDGGRQGGAAALLHQGCSVAVHDCQVVVVTGGMGLNVKCIELQ